MASDDQVIRLSRIVEVVYLDRWRAAALFLAFLALFALGAWLRISYNATAVLRTPELTLAEFKRSVEGASDPVIVADLAERRFPGDTRIAGAALGIVKDPDFADRFTPIYTISRADLREAQVTAPPGADQIVGVQTSVSARDPRLARETALLLARAFADGALKSALVEYVTLQRGVVQTSADRLDAKEASDRALLKRVEARIDDLRRLRSAYPDAQLPYPNVIAGLQPQAPPEAKPITPIAPEQRPAPTPAETMTRYLAPVAQLVGAESEAIAIRDTMRQSQRRHAILDWQRRYFDQAAALKLASLSGEGLLGRLETMVKPEGAGAGDADDPAHEARAATVADLSYYRGRYVDAYTLLRMPPERLVRAGPSLSVQALGAVLASIVLALMVTLALRWRSLAA